MPLCLLPSVDLETLYLLAISVYAKVSHSSRLSIAASASSMRLILVELCGVGVGCNSLGLKFRRALRRSGRCSDLHGIKVKCYVPSKMCLLDAVCCVLCVLLLFPNALQTSLYYYSAPCPSVFQHIPEMLYHSMWEAPCDASSAINARSTAVNS
jgi:hypothetical protein